MFGAGAALLVVALAVGSDVCRAAAADAPLTLCECSGTNLTQWSPLAGAAAQAAPLRPLADTTQCVLLAKTVGSRTCDGLCAYLGPCGAAPPRFYTQPSTSHPPHVNIHVLAAGAGADNLCLDINEGALYAQAYACLDDANQQYTLDTAQHQIREAFDAQRPDACLAQSCPPPAFCPQYHAISSPNLYDPSGPLQTADGLWHMWEDLGGWSHYTSRDLLRWTKVQASTGFSGLTGSTAVTPAGTFAFWPQGDQKAILSAASTDTANLTTWRARGATIPAPPYVGSNFRDPARALALGGAWYVGVGCNNHSASADFCWFRAASPALDTFTDVGPLFSTTTTFGYLDANISWHADPQPATMLECPDIFALDAAGSVHGILGSLFSTNQWWTGRIAGSPPRFTPTSVGLVDYGNCYAAKTGASHDNQRRLLFAFSGWKAPTALAACGRHLLIPRDVRLGADGASMRFSPIPELQTLRLPATHTASAIASLQTRSTAPVPLAGGAQAELRVSCALSDAAGPPSGVVALRVLAAPDGSPVYTAVGFDLDKRTLFVDHDRCCGEASPNSGVRQSSAPLAAALLGSHLNITVYLDGELLEVFINDLATITALVAPSVAVGGPPETRLNALVSTGNLACSTASWKLASVPPSPPPDFN